MRLSPTERRALWSEGHRFFWLLFPSLSYWRRQKLVELTLFYREQPDRYR